MDVHQWIDFGVIDKVLDKCDDLSEDGTIEAIESDVMKVLFTLLRFIVNY